MHLHHGYRFEGLPVLIIWTVFIGLAILFEAEVRRLQPWAFFLLMVLVTAISVVGEVLLYRVHTRSSRLGI